MSQASAEDVPMQTGDGMTELDKDPEHLLLGSDKKLVVVSQSRSIKFSSHSGQSGYARVIKYQRSLTNLCLQLPGATTHAVSFQIEREDHTLGNSLRYFISKNPDVEFCGYTIPHPSETKMNIRIQTWGEFDVARFRLSL